MPKLIDAHGQTAQLWSDSTTDVSNALLPITDWTLACGQGFWLGADTDPSLLTIENGQAPLIAIVFAEFRDGRGFSLARLLRERFGFTGPLIAAGAFMQDQLCYLKRCGFSHFEVDDTLDLESAAVSLQDFSDSYQASCDEQKPLFRRRQ